MRYDPNTFTYGFELEVGDVDRRRPIPTEFGKWEFSERDIVNSRGKYHGVAADPLGINPPFGGEVNIMPGRSPVEVTRRIDDLLNWFRNHGDSPTVSHRTHSHVHIRVPGLRDDIDALKRLTRFIRQHQHQVIEHCHGFKDREGFTREARNYLKWDGARTMPDWMADNINDKATDFEDFIRIQCCGKDGVSRGRPIRYAINTYCMKHIDTIEFRMFRGTLNRYDIHQMLCFVQHFMNAALNNLNYDVARWIRLHHTNGGFPPMTYDHNLQLGWEKTAHAKDRGKKRRELIVL